MDKIVLTQDSYEFICDWYAKTQPLITRIPEVLHKYTLDFLLTGGGMVSYVAEWVDTDKVRFMVDTKTSHRAFKFLAFFDYKVSEMREALSDLGLVGSAQVHGEFFTFPCHVYIDDVAEGQDDPYEHKMAGLVASLHSYVMYFMANFQSELIEYVSTSAVKSAKKKKKGKKAKPRTHAIQVININQYVRDVKSGRKPVVHNRKKCNYSFGVKGHYRHYKSGKVVWIAPYQKNTAERRQKRDKLYKFNLGGKKK